MVLAEGAVRERDRQRHNQGPGRRIVVAISESFNEPAVVYGRLHRSHRVDPTPASRERTTGQCHAADAGSAQGIAENEAVGEGGVGDVQEIARLEDGAGDGTA